MRFVLIGFDHTDAGALDRRMAARPAHMEIMKTFKANGTLKYSGPLVSKDGKMIGSLMIHEYETERDLKEDFLAREPYFLEGVWKEISIYPHFPAEGIFSDAL